jgi:hypothetical protein
MNLFASLHGKRILIVPAEKMNPPPPSAALRTMLKNGLYSRTGSLATFQK